MISASIAEPTAIRYQTNGMKLRVEIHFMNQAMLAYPTANAMSVARIVGPQETWVPSPPISESSKSPEASTAGMASRKEYRSAASRR
jgi:hypothetical protein